MFGPHSFRNPFSNMDPDSDIESDTFSMASASVSLPARSMSSATSYDFDHSMRSPSPVSVMSIDSTMQLYKQEFGRELNNYSDVYRLPADTEELERLDRQHGMFIDIMGNKYVPGMEDVMADDVPGETKACLDLGCGAGSWIVDVARDFPRCNAVAVDLIPMQARSEVDDINLGLEHYFGDFNVVHARLISAGIKDYHRMISQLGRVVRPGGLIDLSEFDFYIYDQNHRRIMFPDNEVRSPWWARWMQFMHDAVKAKGGDVDAATFLFDWVKAHPAFEHAEYQEYWLPIVPPPRVGVQNTERNFKIDEMMRENVTTFLRSGRPLLLGNGHSEAVVDELERKAIREISERRIPQFTRLQCVYARRKVDYNEP